MVCDKYGPHMERQSALSASSRCTKMENTAILVLTPKVDSVPCVASKSLTPNYTNKAMYRWFNDDISYVNVEYVSAIPSIPFWLAFLLSKV
ncbi:hypothetical protein AG4045_006578 [Apium graveolens]|uniref:Uncharacterized protein n=1 Tax=Apium graveolens TaxID=4045 RepID=A0A6L5BBN5_APIGR|nr:hypothetical protein AG4045_006578 [Apium graveolens]